MTSRLFERIARLVRADAHGVVGALEDRTLLLEQHLREAELALAEKRARAQALAEDDVRLGRALDAERAEATRLDEDAILALEGGKEDLARFALRRLLASRRRGDALAAAREKARAEREQVVSRLEMQEQSLAELRERAKLRRAQAETRAACASSQLGDAATITDEEVALELLRRRAAEGGAS